MGNKISLNSTKNFNSTITELTTNQLIRTSNIPRAKGNNLSRTCLADSTLYRNGAQHRANVTSTATPIFINCQNL